jgi:hypothetical protein
MLLVQPHCHCSSSETLAIIITTTTFFKMASVDCSQRLF